MKTKCPVCDQPVKLVVTNEGFEFVGPSEEEQESNGVDDDRR